MYFLEKEILCTCSTFRLGHEIKGFNYMRTGKVEISLSV